MAFQNAEKTNIWVVWMDNLQRDRVNTDTVTMG